MANLSAISMLSEVDGALLIDKPAGLAAHDVERAIKAHFNLVKTGHGATLEPGASGVFVMLLGDGTKLAQDLLGADGAWEGKFRLGRTTDTACEHGRLLAEADFSAVTEGKLAAAAKDLRGDIYQTPPAFSAVRINGRPDWDVVATDKDAAPRFVHLYRFAVTAFAPPYVSFSLVGTKGVSLRALAHDLGQALGCGATLAEARRVKTGKFAVADALPLMDIVQLDPVAFKGRVIPVFEAARR